jgi:hypothetical protein
MRPQEIYRRTDAAPVEPLGGREHSGIFDREAAEAGSRLLLDATQALFRQWEQRHGFVEGAAKILLPAGYRP